MRNSLKNPCNYSSYTVTICLKSDFLTDFKLNKGSWHDMSFSLTIITQHHVNEWMDDTPQIQNIKKKNKKRFPMLTYEKGNGHIKADFQCGSKNVTEKWRVIIGF